MGRHYDIEGWIKPISPEIQYNILDIANFCRNYSELKNVFLLSIKHTSRIQKDFRCFFRYTPVAYIISYLTFNVTRLNYTSSRFLKSNCKFLNSCAHL